jgi:ATP-dependent exoDNAse (exonuclease V) beta subunit
VEVLIAGQIDILKKTNLDRSQKGVEIIDYKTEKIDGVYSADYDRRLRYYALPCNKSLSLKPQRAIVYHLADDSIT